MLKEGASKAPAREKPRRTLARDVEVLIETRMKVGERRVSPLLGRAGEKDASFSILLLAEGPDVQQHLPGFLFG